MNSYFKILKCYNFKYHQNIEDDDIEEINIVIHLYCHIFVCLLYKRRIRINGKILPIEHVACSARVLKK